ncbi:anhydro-N-acetylmuramic acid kinase [Salinivibrio kushneri]|uniref:anhydro-N-acetylmuramic acid kinase n=1 Tax=Salinivibrio kushneri TaxID=1908198 RepID=UPI00098639F1|nr:anhydro-N-acetylmuramic acid kinase [Salinivibrio kushneri]OOE50172.1 anhydro-N-acetylmuramic acid kinase [Salinivibrio kushneri]OOE55064.1 anhydro-N-acetylmuramic acid kinase [Salinivibrio kushneri]OOE62855.1 anhydro-N-acetylmuramic acid kinase [Salinivibrio kushneri]
MPQPAADIYIGVMSGTSLDNIDVVAVRFTHAGYVESIARHSDPLPQDIKTTVITLSRGHPMSVKALGELDRRLGECYANTINTLLEKAALRPKHVAAVGCHGQTVYHQPSGDYPFTMQLGDANVIAARTGITTVADFRRKDMAYGGQGAPLVPAFHNDYFADSEQATAVVNIGGIANVSMICPDRPLYGFDTGPGNMLMDAWTQRHRHQAYDKDGEWAATSCAYQPLLNRLLSDAYFSRPAPKSTGREYFNLDWLDRQLLAFSLSPDQVQATLLALTAESIALAIRPLERGRVFVCGGGAHNQALMHALQQALPQWSIAQTDDAGISCDDMEAIAFAWLARQTLNHQPGNVPAVTGATQACCLGAIYLPY